MCYLGEMNSESELPPDRQLPSPPDTPAGVSVKPPYAADLSALAPEVAATVASVAGDIALVVDHTGVIRNVSAARLGLQSEGAQWLGRPWADTVAAGTRQKVEALLTEAQRHGVSRRRELNHAGPGGTDIPMSWAAVRLGEHGPVLAVGRDLRAVNAIQQRFLEAQQELERDYWQRRQTDNHYRVLFQVANDAVLVLDAEHFTVLEANPAAATLFDQASGALVGQLLHPCIETTLQPALEELLVTARATGHTAELRLRLAARGSPIDMSATPFTADGKRCLLLRARRAEPAAGDPHAVHDFMDNTPDAVVVTDTAGRLMWANRAFAELCEAPNDLQLKGRGIADLMGDQQQQWLALLARVRARGVVGHMDVTLRVLGAPALSADVSAALLTDGEQEHIGFTLRPRSNALPATVPTRMADDLALDMAALSAQLGQLSLPELLVEAARLAEVHFIRTALQGAGGRLDTASVALHMPAESLLRRMNQLGLGLPGPTGSEGHPPLVN